MILTIYQGTRLLSVSYCNRKLEELEQKNTLSHIREYDVTLGTLEKDEELKALAKSISYYRDIIERLKESFSNLTDEELINFVIEQMVSKIKESKLSKVSISFSHVSKYTIEIKINNVFTTELTFKNKVYKEISYPNEHYDGYNDTAEFIVSTVETPFLKEVISTINTSINEKLPGILTQ